MTVFLRAMCWAVAMLFAAAVRRFGLIDRKVATTLLIVLAILALLSLRGRSRCVGERA